MLSRQAFEEILGKLLFSVPGKPKVLLAVSGGVDSVVMASLFAGTELCDFAVAHMNFTLRGEESDGDEAFVREWCLKHGVRFFSRKVATEDYASGKGISIEMAARELRYDWFNELADEVGFDFIAVAHNLNDSVETMYLNLLRGTGLRGLCGIRPVNGRVIRPLLDFSRSEILEFSSRNGVAFRTDSTNADIEFSRNRLRNNVFPELAGINPSFLETSRTEASRFAEIDDLLGEILSSKEGSLYVYEDGILKIDIEALKKEKHKGYWLFRLLDRFGFNASQLEEIASSIDGQTGVRFETVSHTALIDRGYVKIYPNDDASLPEVVWEVVDIPENFNPADVPPLVQFLDAGKVEFPISVRSPRDGDRFRPLGMKGSKLVNDFLSDIRIDLLGKRRQAVVCDASGVVICVAPYRIDDRFKITSCTTKILKITVVDRK